MKYLEIAEGLKNNYRNYELYFMLGQYYESKNTNQAYLCYENAEYYCDDESDLGMIQSCKQSMAESSNFCVKKTSIIVISYNMSVQTRECLESIRENNLASSYELIVVDNASEENNAKWIKDWPNIKFIENSENKGFPYACNQGIKISEGENDILILHNDTLMMPNAIYQLRMGLYENAAIGATGSVATYALNHQGVSEQYTTLEGYIDYARQNNIPSQHAYEKKVWLVGCGLMLKREAVDEVGLFDIRFSPGSFEDCDLGIRLNYAGWRMVLCKNSFILHYGQGGGANGEVWRKSKVEHENAIAQKWNLEMSYYTYARTEIIDLIKRGQEEHFTVLEVGCGCGSTLARIEYLWPKATVCGIELMENVARIGGNYLDVIQGDIENMELSYQEKSFDYIIIADVLEHLYHPEEILKRLRSYLKEDGKLLCSVPNIMHKSVMEPLKRGEFEYQDIGILDRTHIHFFTLSSMKKMFHRCGMKICDLGGKAISGKSELIELDENDTASEQLAEVYQLIVSVQRM